MSFEPRRRVPADSNDLWFLISVSLLVAAVLFILAAAIRALAGDGVALRERVEVISGEGANIVIIALVLGAVVALHWVGDAGIRMRTRPLLVLALLLAAVILLLKLFSIFDFLTVDDDSNAFSQVLVRPGGWNGRFAAILQECATGFVAIVTMIAANRTAAFSGSRGSGGLPPG